MKKKVKTEHLELGMYIILGVPWYKHPFVKGEFVLRDEDQIQQLFESDIREVTVDPEKSIVIEKERTPARIKTNEDKPSIRTNLPNTSREVSRGERVPVQEKLKAMQKYSEDQRKSSGPQPDRSSKPLSASIVSGESRGAVLEEKIPAREKLKAMQKYSEDQRKASGPQPERSSKPLSATVATGESRGAVPEEKIPAREKLKAMQRYSEDQRKSSGPQPERSSKPLSATVVSGESSGAVPGERIPAREKLKAMQRYSEDQRKLSGPQLEQTAKQLSVSVMPDEPEEASRGERLSVGENLKAIEKQSEGQRQVSGPQLEETAKLVSVSVVSEELQEVIHNVKLPAPVKAKAVQKHTMKMISNLLDNPSAENIRDVKKGIAEVVDVILSTEDTSYYLMNITSHDLYTYTHSVNVGFLGVLLSKVLFRKSTAHDMHELGAGFFLHDLGKVRVDQAIINKPGKLTDEEMEQIRQHPDMGYKILMETNQLTNECKKIVMQHHERFDGLGYPQKLKGEDIHLYGRICSIADVFEALTSDRPYRKKMHPFVALSVMKEEMIKHFQKDLFEQFVLLFTRA